MSCFPANPRLGVVLLQTEMEERHVRVIEYSAGVRPMRKRRKNYTPVEKVAILHRHLIDKVPVTCLRC